MPKGKTELFGTKPKAEPKAAPAPKRALKADQPNVPLAEQVCSDCGVLGCLIPVTHRKAG